MSGRMPSFRAGRPERASGRLVVRPLRRAAAGRVAGRVEGQERIFRRVGLIALLLALAMRMAVPTGFMWEPAVDGGARLVSCSGMAPMPVAVAPAAHGGHHMGAPSHGKSHDGDTGSSRECAFSGLAGALDLADPLLTPALALIAAFALPLPVARAAAPGRGLAAPPPPSRGPPATV